MERKFRSAKLFIVFGLLSFEAFGMQEQKVTVLYKILSAEDWKKSEQDSKVHTSASDHPFIHFSTEKQFPGIVQKKFTNVAHVVLKIDPAKLVGDLKLEWDSKYTDQYYHLHNGHIPKEAVIGQVQQQ